MPNPCRQRSFWARIKLSEKIIFITHFTVRDLFSQRRFVTLLICTIVQIYCFFTTTFQVLFKTFKIWLGLIARFNFSRNTQINTKKHLQRKPIYFHQGFRYLQHFSALQDAFPPSAIFSSDCYIELAFRELLSFVMLLNVSSIAYLSNTFFKKNSIFSEVFYTETAKTALSFGKSH